MEVETTRGAGAVHNCCHCWPDHDDDSDDHDDHDDDDDDSDDNDDGDDGDDDDDHDGDNNDDNDDHDDGDDGDDDDDDNDDNDDYSDDHDDLTYPMTTCEYPSCGRKGEMDDLPELCNVSGFSGPGIRLINIINISHKHFSYFPSQTR